MKKRQQEGYTVRSRGRNEKRITKLKLACCARRICKQRNNAIAGVKTIQIVVEFFFSIIDSEVLRNKSRQI